MTHWKVVSFDRRLSDRKTPSSSEEFLDRLQNWSSVNRLGTAADTTHAVAKTSPKRARAERRHERGRMEDRMAADTSMAWLTQVAFARHPPKRTVRGHHPVTLSAAASQRLRLANHRSNRPFQLIPAAAAPRMV